MTAFDKARARAIIDREHPEVWDEWMIAAIARVEELEVALREACGIATQQLAIFTPRQVCGTDSVEIKWSGPVTVDASKPFQTLYRIHELAALLPAENEDGE